MTHEYTQKMTNKSYSWIFFLVIFFIFFAVFIIFDKTSTDYKIYTERFIIGCNSNFPNHHEAGYYYSAYFLSKLFFIDCDLVGFEIYKVVIFLILAVAFSFEIFLFMKKRYFGGNRNFISAGLVVLLLTSIVPIQIVWNFRGGYSTIFALMFITLLLTENKSIFLIIRMLAYAALSISMHTQSILALSVFVLLFLIYKFVGKIFFLFGLSLVQF